MSVEPIIFVDVDYDELDPETYRGVVLTLGLNGPTIRFADSNDFDQDAQEAKEWFARYFPAYTAVTMSSFDQYQAERGD